jgi:KipI family sensor histidine kinase inhibitor
MTPLYDVPRFLSAGDAAVAVELGDGISREVNAKVHALDRAVRAAALEGILDTIPSYRSLLVCYDPLRLAPSRLRDLVGGLFATLGGVRPEAPRVVRIPACYGGAFGPDLPFVASHNGLTPAAVVDIHAGAEYAVYMMGFCPGFTYLGELSERIAAPRLRTPRTAIPAGSVGIAQQQTGIYPVESPGGWQLIGRTPVRLFDASRTPPTALEPGDLVRFVPIDQAGFEAIHRRVAAGEYEIDVVDRRP